MESFNDRLPFVEWEMGSSLDQALTAIQGEVQGITISCPLSADDLVQLFDVIDNNMTLIGLNFSDCQLNDDGLKIVAEGMKYNKNIAYFGIFNNDLSISSARLVAEMVGVNKTLISFRLKNTNLSDDGVKALSHELEYNNRSVIHLDLTSNKIGKNGAKRLAKALLSNNIVTALSLHDNEIEATGGRSISTVLEENYSLAYLDLSDNKIEDDLLKEIETKIQDNTEMLRKSFEYASDHAESGPLRTAKVMIVGQDGSGKSTLVKALLGTGTRTEYRSTLDLTLTRLQARIDGSPWYRLVDYHSPKRTYTTEFLARFANIELDKMLDEKAEKEKENSKGGLITSIRRASVGQKKKNGPGVARRGSIEAANANKRNSFMAMAQLASFGRKKNVNLDDGEYVFSDDAVFDLSKLEGVLTDEQIEANFSPEIIARARRERDNISFNLYEFCGHRIFYTMHHSFLTKTGIYVLTFSLENMLLKGEFGEHNTIRYLNYWLKSIKYHSPGANVMLVGTHLDSVKESVSDVKRDLDHVDSVLAMIVYPKMKTQKEAVKMKNAFDAANKFAKKLETEASNAAGSRKLNVLKDGDKRLFFAVDLSSVNKTVAAVRKKLDEAAPQQDFFAKSVPIKWMQFLDQMLANGENWLEATKVKECAEETLKGSENIEKEMTSALEMLHELGYIIYITNLKSFRGFVITNPQWLVDATTKIMYSEDVQKFDKEEALKSNLADDVKAGLDHGLISRDFMNFLWGETDTPFFIKYLEQNLLISRWGYGEQGKQSYVAPSLVPRRQASEGAAPDEGSDLKAFFTFGNYLTLGVFERLVCQVVQSTIRGFPDSRPPKLYAGFSQHWFGDDFEFCLRRENNFILCTVISSKKAPIKCISRLLKMFQKLGDLLGQGFSVSTSLIVKKEYVDYADVKTNKLSPWY